MQKPLDVQEKWYLVNAEGKTRWGDWQPRRRGVAWQTPSNLYPSCDMGDHVVIVNAEKIHLTGNKMATKLIAVIAAFRVGSRPRRRSMFFEKIRQNS